MTPLSPAPSTLGLSSPALGPWFEASDSSSADLADLPPCDADLSVPRDLPTGAIWNAPVNGLLSYFVATPTRPAALSTLRQADGSPAFADGAFVLLFTLLPEVAARLGALSQAVPRPDAATAATGDVRTRPMITHLAMELPANSITSVADLTAILPSKGGPTADIRGDMASPDLDDDIKRAGLLGLSPTGGISNMPRPATILRRPEKDDARLLENASSATINAKLWAFTKGGRAYDAGAVAAVWNRLAGTDWNNLWAAAASRPQRTAGVEDAKTVLLVNAHQGPLEAPIKARIAGQLTDLTALPGSDEMFRAGTAPAIALSPAADANTDTAPVPLVAPLPAGPYAAPGSATPFAGWADADALARDFQRVAITDVERHLIGLGRDAGSVQADPRRRVVVAQNTADPLFLADADAVATQVMARFADTNSALTMIAPELDRDYGPQPRATLGSADPFVAAFDDPVATAHALKGSGSTDGNTAEDQSIVLRFDTTLPAGAWVRAWPHGRDTTTGRRFRMTGGAALADATGSALLILPLPNGENGGGAADVPFSYDLSLTTSAGNRLLVDRRGARPGVDTSGGAADIAALGGGQSLYCCETAAQPAAGAGAIAPGQSIMVLNGAVSDEDYSALDRNSLRASDLSAALPNRADGTDRLVTNEPAFLQTTQGNIPDAQTAGGPVRVHEAGFHTGSQAQEIYDFAAFEATGNQGVIGAVMARDLWHESPPAALGHPGVNAAPEIHGEGLGVAGPAANQLRLLMRERSPADIVEFVTDMGTPLPSITPPTTAGPWTAFLETAAKGTHGDLLISLIPDGVTPGAVWDNPDTANQGIKQRIDAVLGGLPGGQTVDGLIDSATFDDDVASAAFDRLLDKNRTGVRDFARAAMAAIGRAEDLIWLQTPALDIEAWTGTEGDIRFVQAMTDRLAANPALRVVLVLPQKHLPGRNIRLEAIRKSALGAALDALQTAAEDRVAWVVPAGGPDRAFHMSSTTLVVDDAVLFSGAAHGWRRGLTYDSALTGAVFDERLAFGRPQEVVVARRILAGALLGVQANLVPDNAAELVLALKAQNIGGGFGRANPSAYTPETDPTPGPDREVWNPASSDAFNLAAAIAALAADLRTEFETGTR